MGACTLALHLVFDHPRRQLVIRLVLLGRRDDQIDSVRAHLLVHVTILDERVLHAPLQLLE